MWDSCIRQPVNLNAPYDIPFESSAATLEKKPCDKQLNNEKELCLNNDTDFQSFLLPLEQDFTKSSKGYASLLSATPNKEIKSIDYKNKCERSAVNVLPCENFSDDDYFKSTDKLLYNNFSYSNDHGNINNADNLYYEKCAQSIYDNLENIKDKNIDGMFSKSHIKIEHNSSENSPNGNQITETKKNIVYLENCIKTTHEFSLNLFNSGIFSDKSDYDCLETASFYKECNNSQNFDDVSNSIVFSDDKKIKNWLSSIEIEQTFNTSINSDSSESSGADDDCHKESEKRTTSIFSEDFSFEFSTVNPLENSMPSERNLCDSIIAFSSEGYINASFENDDFLFEKASFIKDINSSWNDSMKNISEEPHESKRVSFVPLPDLVSVFSYEPEDDDYRYSLHVLDQLRFQSRIKDFESIIAPYITPEHRENIYRKNYFQD